MYTHPAKVSYIVSPGILKITNAMGRSFVSKEEKGSTRWAAAVGEHSGENIGNTPVCVVFVEVKSVDDTPEDITNYDRKEEVEK